MEIMKSLHPRFTDIFWTDQLEDDVHHNRFTMGRFVRKDALWQGLCLFLCGVVFASAQHGFKDDEEDRIYHKSGFLQHQQRKIEQ